jgi:tagatose-1,6-bisphosphate aldolase
MLDAELGATAFDEGAVPSAVGLIMPLEAQGYEAGGDGRTTTLMADFAPIDALRYGADACKVLLPYRADDERSAASQDALVADAVADCHAVGLPLVVEPLVYPWSTETPDAFAAGYTSLVVDAVRRLRPLGADLLKLPFPVRDLTATTEAVATAACHGLAEACGDTPWVLLGAGADPETFIEQIRLAGTAGAAGFLVGRGIWGPVLRADARETERLAATDARVAFERCRAMGERVARPLTADRPA